MLVTWLILLCIAAVIALAPAGAVRMLLASTWVLMGASTVILIALELVH